MPDHYNIIQPTVVAHAVQSGDNAHRHAFRQTDKVGQFDVYLL